MERLYFIIAIVILCQILEQCSGLLLGGVLFGSYLARQLMANLNGNNNAGPTGENRIL